MRRKYKQLAIKVSEAGNKSGSKWLNLHLLGGHG